MPSKWPFKRSANKGGTTAVDDSSNLQDQHNSPPDSTTDSTYGGSLNSEQQQQASRISSSADQQRTQPSTSAAAMSNSNSFNNYNRNSNLTSSSAGAGAGNPSSLLSPDMNTGRNNANTNTQVESQESNTHEDSSGATVTTTTTTTTTTTVVNGKPVQVRKEEQVTRPAGPGSSTVSEPSSQRPISQVSETVIPAGGDAPPVHSQSQAQTQLPPPRSPQRLSQGYHSQNRGTSSQGGGGAGGGYTSGTMNNNSSNISPGYNSGSLTNNNLSPGYTSTSPTGAAAPGSGSSNVGANAPHSNANNYSYPKAKGSTLRDVQQAAAAVHGAGEAIRGTLNSHLDRRFGHAPPETIAQHEAVRRAGQSEISQGQFSELTRERETTGKVRGILKKSRPVSGEGGVGGVEGQGVAGGY